MISNIKKDINNNLGRCVKVIYNEGRNKIFIYEGRIIEVYNNIFIIMDDNSCCKRCFSYYDVLINRVRLSFKR